MFVQNFETTKLLRFKQFKLGRLSRDDMPELGKKENYKAGKLPTDERNRTESQSLMLG